MVFSIDRQEPPALTGHAVPRFTEILLLNHETMKLRNVATWIQQTILVSYRKSIGKVNRQSSIAELLKMFFCLLVERPFLRFDSDVRDPFDHFPRFGSRD